MNTMQINNIHEFTTPTDLQLPTILFPYLVESSVLILETKPAIAAMHGQHSVFNIGHCTVIHCDAGGVSLVDQRKAKKN